MVKSIYKGRVITVNIDTVRLPNDTIIDLEIVRHPGASAMVPIKEDGTVILVRQFRHAAGGFIYEIPAGKLHAGEDPKLCAARELEEEIGYRAEHYTLLSSILTAPGFTDEVIHIYKATGLIKTQQRLDQDEVLEVVELPLPEVMTMIHDGRIRDAKTMVGCQLVFFSTLR
ncbi:ADP-ribose pyrophosphatase [Nitrospira japonica]|uniref:GDP-mannose pyrophosphatase n=1 Tax=Nitrospira japonica TaxID=1325564 RepID=A0A1W1I3L1_9BACT|nr:NUDIX hydrolase [Nitrospira japonica]SLM47541.1 ADP-ribose pyrophosphatase [Nitrospira japonica]